MYRNMTQRRVNNVLWGTIAGGAAGMLFLGAGVHVALRSLDWISGLNVYTSLGGVRKLVMLSGLIGIAGGAFFQLTYVNGYIPGLVGGKGATFGLLLFIVLIPLTPEKVVNELLSAPDYLPFIISTFGLLLMGYGLTLELLLRHFTAGKKIHTIKYYVNKGKPRTFQPIKKSDCVCSIS
jgi:hypothetical protein